MDHADASSGQVIAREYDAKARRELSSGIVELRPGLAARAGRAVAGEPGTFALDIGIAPVDSGVSREALHIARDNAEWIVEVRNQRGAMLHPWGQRSAWLEPNSTSVIARSTKVAIRVLGALPDVEHWILLESDADRGTNVGETPDEWSPAHTDVRRPAPLTPKQEAAVRAVFGEYLEWPPRSNPQASKLMSAARTLGISETGVVERLEGVKSKSQALGLHEQFGVTTPDYLYVLVARGYLRPDDE